VHGEERRRQYPHHRARAEHQRAQDHAVPVSARHGASSRRALRRRVEEFLLRAQLTRFAIATRDELWLRGRLSETRISRGEAIHDESGITASDVADDALAAA